MDEFNFLKKEAEGYNHECRMYAQCMREIKQRLFFIRERLALGSSDERKIFDTEILCLQFRAIFELIYLSNLAAHQKLYTKGYDKLKREWRTSSIARFIETHNPDFYPTPVNVKYEIVNEELKIDLTLVESGFLTKPELLEFYEKCSAYIHPRNPFCEESDFKIWLIFPELFHKICRLLEAHVVNMFKSKKGLFVYINLNDKITKYEDVRMAYLAVKSTVIH